MVKTRSRGSEAGCPPPPTPPEDEPALRHRPRSEDAPLPLKIAPWWIERCPSTAWTHPTEPEPGEGGGGVRTSSQVTRQQLRSAGINATMLLSQLLQQRSAKKRRRWWRRDSVWVFSSLNTPACRAPHRRPAGRSPTCRRRNPHQYHKHRATRRGSRNVFKFKF